VSHLVNAGKSAAGAVLSKSATLLPQSGNPMPRLKKLDVGAGRAVGSINSEGLPNNGIEYYVSDEVLDAVKATGKPYIVSLSGLSTADNLAMLGKVAAAAARKPNTIAAVELNLACPNIPGKPTVALDFDQMADVLDAVAGHAAFRASGLPLGVKLAPYFDGPHLDRAAALINACERVSFVVTMNTIGNCLVVDTATEAALIAPKGGFGGVGGGFAKPIALAQVAGLRKRLDARVDIVGVGGVRTGEDAFQLILCGATAVQSATTHWLEGPKCFNRIDDELRALMASRGYTKLADFRGNLRAYDKKNPKHKGGPKAAAAAAPTPYAPLAAAFALGCLATLALGLLDGLFSSP